MKELVLPRAIRKQLEQDTNKSTFSKYLGLRSLLQRKKKRKQRKLIKNKNKETIVKSKVIPPKSSSVTRKSRQLNQQQDSVNQPMKGLFSLQRKIRALWNRLSEGNAETIANSLENLMDSLGEKGEQESFHFSFVALLLESLNNHSSLVSSVHPYISSFAAVVAFFHFRGHVAISSRLVYELFQQILCSDERQEQEENSQLDMFSLLGLVMELYKLQVIHCQVIYELIRYFASNLSETSAQCLLVMIRRCGVELRKDDPRALKDIIEYIRENAESQRKNSVISKVFSTRLEMILELIYDWKDNKLLVNKKDSNECFPWLANMITTAMASNNYSLLFSLELQDWNTFYDCIVSKNSNEKQVKDTTTARDKTSETMQMEIVSVDKVVSSQRLNTDTRRNIFRMIMTSEDVIDAEHRLVEFGGKKKLWIREIANMVIFGCCHERLFNPFYVALTKRLCRYSPRYKKAFQFSLWQVWKRMEQGEKWSSTKLRNLSSYIAELLLERVFSLSCFRVLPNLSHFTPSLKQLLCLILQVAMKRPNDDLLVLLKENISDVRCHAFYFTLYFLLQQWKDENHARVNEWLHFLQSCVLPNSDNNKLPYSF